MANCKKCGKQLAKLYKNITGYCIHCVPRVGRAGKIDTRNFNYPSVKEWLKT